MATKTSSKKSRKATVDGLWTADGNSIQTLFRDSLHELAQEYRMLAAEPDIARQVAAKILKSANLERLLSSEPTDADWVDLLETTCVGKPEI
ncbi:MAG: hypothetical protein NZ823_01590 [Blastocatellia bacterium]|nr:hypothetical protein [Blastocatellia bacterium]